MHLNQKVYPEKSKMRIYVQILLFTIIITSISAAQQHDSTLAEVGKDNISVSEFRERFELAPQVYIAKDNPYDNKHSLLYSMIAERLWSLQARKLGLDTTMIMKTSFKALEKMYVRDALYKSEIGNKVNTSEKELQEGLKKYFITLKLETLRSKDSSKIFTLYDELKNGASFDSLHNVVSPNIPALDVNYGDMAKPVEDIVYSLKKNDFTHPIKDDAGWFIFKVAGRIEKSHTAKDINEVLEKVKKIIKDRKAQKYYDEYVDKFFNDKRVTTNGDLFWSMADKITSIMQNKKKTQNIPDTVNVYLSNSDFLKLENELGPDTLKMVFINFKENPFTVEDFLRYFIFEGFYSAQVDKRTLVAKLNGRVRRVIQEELLAREGYKRGYENLPKVRESIHMWKDNYLAKLLKDKLLDSTHVTGPEVREYYNEQNKLRKKNETEVNILEILTDSLSTAKKLLNEIEHGADFRKLASANTKRKWTRAKGGEFGYFPAAEYGEIGRTAATLKIGEIYGPLKTQDGYSIFKLIGKKEKKLPPPPSFESEKAKLRKELYARKESKFLIAYTVKLAKKYGVKINENLLQNISVKDLKMYVYRYMGFGGRIAAVPQVLPFVEWYKPWEKNEKVVP